MHTIPRLGHVGLYVQDLDKMRKFYEEVIGLTVTDVVPDQGLVFLSSHPAEEHHELLLIKGEETSTPGTRLNQVSFRCESLEDVHEYWCRFRDIDVPIEMVVSHGNAVGVYFLDPESNTVEVYWPTGLEARQPFMEHVDLSAPLDDIRAHLNDRVREYGLTGYVSPEFQQAG